MALGILSLVLVSSYALATGTFRLGRGAGERTQAVNYLQQQAEALRSYRNRTNWDATFANTMSGLTANNATFCMKPPAPGDLTKTWTPVATTNNSACTIEGISIAITSPTVAGAELYVFNLKATWQLASQQNEVTLTTKLAKQD